MEENVIRVDHVYNGKMGIAHMGKSANGISLKQTNTFNSPTLIVNKRSASKLATFSPSHINLNGRSQTGNGQKVITTTTTRYSVLNTTNLKSNITSKNSKYVVTKSNSGTGRKITIFNDDCKENTLKSKRISVSGSKDLIILQTSSPSDSSKKSTEENYCSDTKMQSKTNAEKSESGSNDKASAVISPVNDESQNNTNSAGHEKSKDANSASTDLESNGDNEILSNAIEAKDDEMKDATSEKSQPIVCNICGGEDKKFLGHAAFKLHYNENHCLQHCEICQADCFGSIGLHKHMLEQHVENKPKTNPVLNHSNKITKIAPIETSFGTSNVKVKLATSQNNVPLQRTMKDIRYHQEVIPKNCNPKRYKTLHRCQECKYMTYHGQNLNRHIDSFHHKRSCSYCGVVCTGKKPLTDHLRLVHQVKVSPEKFCERRSNSEALNKYQNTQKKLSSTLLKKSKNWVKPRMDNEMRSSLSWSKKISKQGKIDYNKLSAKQRILRNLRKELEISSKDQRNVSGNKHSMLFEPRNMEDNETVSGKCPYCDIVLSNKDLMCQHIESEHGIALKFHSQYHNNHSSVDEEDEEENEGNSNAAIHYKIKKYNQTNSLKRKRYSSESSHNGSTDDYDEEDGTTLHLDRDPLYNNFYLEAEYDAFKGEDKDFVQSEISNGDAVSMENIMQKAFCNVMSFSTSVDSEDSTELCLSDSENTMPINHDDTHTAEVFINGSSPSFAKCLPTNEDLAAWELFRDF